MRTIASLLLTTTLAFVTSSAGAVEILTDFETGREESKKSGKLILVQFMTPDCPYSAVFHDLVDSEADIQAAIDPLIYIRLDATRSKGKFHAARHEVKGTPTFIVYNPANQPLHQWRGYGKAPFLENLAWALTDSSSVADRVQRVKTNPTARDAAMMGMLRISTGSFLNGIEYLEQAESLGSRSFAPEIFDAAVLAQQAGEIDLEKVIEAAESALKDANESETMSVAAVMEQVTLRADRPAEAAPFLDAAFAKCETSELPNVLRMKKSLEPAYVLYVKEDQDRAIEAKISQLPAGWQDSSPLLNHLAWWCAQRSVALSDALTWADRALTLAESESEKATYFDTTAEIYLRQGEPEKALEALKRAVSANPESSVYQRRLAELETSVKG